MIAKQHESSLKSQGGVVFHRLIQRSAAVSFARCSDREVMTDEFITIPSVFVKPVLQSQRDTVHHHTTLVNLAKGIAAIQSVTACWVPR